MPRYIPPRRTPGYYGPRAPHKGWMNPKLNHVKLLYKRSVNPYRLAQSLNWNRIQQNMFLHQGSNPWYLPGPPENWFGAKVTAVLDVKPEPIKMEGIVFDLKQKSEISRLNCTLTVFEPDDSGAQNPRVISLPMEHPLLKIKIERTPTMARDHKAAVETWMQCLRNQP